MNSLAAELEVLACSPAGKRGDRTVVAFVGGRESIELAADVRFAAGVGVGSRLSEARIAELVAQDEAHRCRAKAWALLSQRLYTCSRLRQALRRGKFSPTAIEAIIGDLRERGHLDDAAYARQHVEHRRSAGASGPRLVRQELFQRGVARDLVDSAVKAMESGGEQEAAARALLEKWNRRKKPEDALKRRQAAAAFLARRGFDMELVWEVVRAMGRDSEE